MRKLMICGVAALLLVLTSVSAYASPPNYFYLEKECAGFPFCGLQEADPFTGLNGGQIEYLTCAPAPDKFLCEAVLTTANGDGKVYGQMRFVSDHGYFTLRQGEGTLAGLHAEGRVDYLGGTTYSLEGTYHVDPL